MEILADNKCHPGLGIITVRAKTNLFFNQFIISIIINQNNNKHEQSKY